jgi:folate-binding protein YgfZ
VCLRVLGGLDHNHPMSATHLPDDLPRIPRLPDPLPWQGALPLPGLSSIHALGPDSASFLHGQLSQDVQNLTPAQARLAAYCSAKGRMLATSIVLRPSDESVFLLTSSDVQAPLLKRLSMFVLRARTKLSDASSQWGIWGLAGDAAQEALERLAPGSGADAAWAVRPCQGGQLIRLPAVLGVSRWLWLGERSAAGWLDALPSLSDVAWSWLDVMSGIPRVQAATVDRFVPQMVNFEVVGGVNFQKGCYPGQEVVARSQYRGTVKRRAVLMHVDAEALAGQEVFSQADPGQPAGMVIMAAQVPSEDGRSPCGASTALVELKLASLGESISLGAPDGPPMQPGTLPYALPSPESDA